MHLHASLVEVGTHTVVCLTVGSVNCVSQVQYRGYMVCMTEMMHWFTRSCQYWQIVNLVVIFLAMIVLSFLF